MPQVVRGVDADLFKRLLLQVLAGVGTDVKLQQSPFVWCRRYQGARHFVSPRVATLLANPSGSPLDGGYNRKDDLHSWLRVCIAFSYGRVLDAVLTTVCDDERHGGSYSGEQGCVGVCGVCVGVGRGGGGANG